MTHRTRHLQRRLAWPLALLWLLISNAALCLVLPAAATPAVAAHAQGAGHHGGAHAAHGGEAHAMHGSPESLPVPEAHGCCADAIDHPCCEDAAYASAFDAPSLAKLVLAPPTVPVLAPDFDRRSRPAAGPRLALPPAQAGPPIYVRCCSFLI